MLRLGNSLGHLRKKKPNSPEPGLSPAPAAGETTTADLGASTPCPTSSAHSGTPADSKAVSNLRGVGQDLHQFRVDRLALLLHAALRKICRHGCGLVLILPFLRLFCKHECPAPAVETASPCTLRSH